GRGQRLGVAAVLHRAHRHLHLAVEEGVEKRFAAVGVAATTQRDLAGVAGLAGLEAAIGRAAGAAGEALQVPLHAELELAGEVHLEDARLDLHLQRDGVQPLDRRLDLGPLRGPGAYQQLVVRVHRADTDTAVLRDVLLVLAGRVGVAEAGG